MSSAGVNSFGTLSSAPNGGIVNHIYTYVTSILVDFTGSTDENENGITNRLCKELEYKKQPECSYFFHHQNVENDIENTSTDFAAFGTYGYAQACAITDLSQPPPLIKFEAKRLSSALPTAREREYVIGEYASGVRTKNSGGIERFKNGRHGHDVSNACMIGYVQSDSFNSWLVKINDWISNEIASPSDALLSWDSPDTLKVVTSSTRVCSYKSTSQRSTGDPIDLRHIWVNFV